MFSSDFGARGERGKVCRNWAWLYFSLLFSFGEGRGVAEDKWQMFLCKSNNRGLFTIFDGSFRNPFQLLNHTFTLYWKHLQSTHISQCLLSYYPPKVTTDPSPSYSLPPLCNLLLGTSLKEWTFCSSKYPHNPTKSFFPPSLLYFACQSPSKAHSFAHVPNYSATPG